MFLEEAEPAKEDHKGGRITKVGGGVGEGQVWKSGRGEESAEGRGQEWATLQRG